MVKGLKFPSDVKKEELNRDGDGKTIFTQFISEIRMWNRWKWMCAMEEEKIIQKYFLPSRHTFVHSRKSNLIIFCLEKREKLFLGVRSVQLRTAQFSSVQFRSVHEWEQPRMEEIDDVHLERNEADDDD